MFLQKCYTPDPAIHWFLVAVLAVLAGLVACAEMLEDFAALLGRAIEESLAFVASGVDFVAVEIEIGGRCHHCLGMWRCWRQNVASKTFVAESPTKPFFRFSRLISFSKKTLLPDSCLVSFWPFSAPWISRMFSFHG